MLKRLRLKFVLINMTIVTILLCVILGLVLHFTRADLESESIHMLQSIAAQPFHLGVPSERGEDARPELVAAVQKLDGYATVFLGYPNWWGDMPMAVYSFLEEYDLSGKTVIPFVTSGGSGFSDTVSRIEELQPDADVKEGIAISASGAMDAREEIRSWLDGLGY